MRGHEGLLHVADDWPMLFLHRPDNTKHTIHSSQVALKALRSQCTYASDDDDDNDDDDASDLCKDGPVQCKCR